MFECDSESISDNIFVKFSAMGKVIISNVGQCSCYNGADSCTCYESRASFQNRTVTELVGQRQKNVNAREAHSQIGPTDQLYSEAEYESETAQVDSVQIKSLATDNGVSTVQRPVFFNESLFGMPNSDDSDIDSVSSSESEGREGDGPFVFSVSDDRFSFMHWNVNGLMTKIIDNNFMTFVSSFHFVCFVETFIETLNDDVFSNHKVFCQPSLKLSRAGRPSGGVVCLIRKEVMGHVRQIKVNGNYLLFVIDKALFGLSKDVLYVCAYVPPEGSAYYSFVGEEEDGIALLENCLFDNALAENDFHIILSGDLNSRTSNIGPTTSDNDSFIDSLHSSDSGTGGRASQDTVINGFGKSLLNMCIALNLCILNGTCEGDHLGCYTYISPFGSSVIDYFLMSGDLLATVYDSCNLNVLERIESCHMPVVLSIKFPNEDIVDTQETVTNEVFEKFIWDQEKAQQYGGSLSSASSRRLLDEALQLIDLDINLALNKFNELIKLTAASMKKRIRPNCFRKERKWFDQECINFRKKVRKALRRYRRSLNNEDRFTFCKVRREYKNLLYLKKKQFNAAIIEKLVSVVHNQQDFWNTIHSILPRRGQARNNISIDDWFQHFKALLEKDEDEPVFNDRDDLDNDDDDELAFNRPISKEEVLLALRKLKSKKAAGPDGLPGEFLKYASDVLAPFFVKFFNALFEKGLYPKNWTESVILPLFKKGDVNCPGNYRGISLCDISSKVFGNIINRRLQEWVEENNITGEVQAGFKKGYSTVDHMFTLMACVQKQLSLHNKLYVAFIDFEKCFDSINRNLLWPVLLKNGIKGKLFRCLRSMYVSVKARVRSGVKLTEVIKCSLGVKQGDSCSPVLFSIFINELAVEVIRQGKHGVNFLIDAFELFILLLADDVVLLSETPVGLQRQLNSLHSSSLSLGLKVNMNKSNIVVFRNGGYLGRWERWFFRDEPMPVVNAYKYLGIYFSTRLSFVAACKDIASKAKRVLFLITRRLRMYNNYSFDVFRQLFDAQVQPIMQYGAEIWGLDDASQHCEKVHVMALKKFLLVNTRTPNGFVYKELNRYPIVINSAMRCVRYWLKLLHMNDDRIPKKAYLMLCRLDASGKRNWVTKVRECLFKFGFGWVWMNQGVGRMNVFVHTFQQRLIDCSWQNWMDHVNNSERYEMYKLFCGNDFDSLPTYLQLDLDSHIKFVMTKFRFGVSELFVHHYRFRNNAVYLCPLCKDAEDTEIHLVLCCPVLEDIRKDLIAEKFYRSPNTFRFTILMSAKQTTVVRNLCIYLYKAFKLRERMM